MGGGGVLGNSIGRGLGVLKGSKRAELYLWKVQLKLQRLQEQTLFYLFTSQQTPEFEEIESTARSRQYHGLGTAGKKNITGDSNDAIMRYWAINP